MNVRRNALLLFALLLLGCQHQKRILPDETVPHRLAKPVDAFIFVETRPGVFTEQSVELPANWWVASPKVVE